MKKIFPLIVFLSVALISLGQNISITFTGTGAAGQVDSVKATNLATGQIITLPGSATLILTPKTGIPVFEENGAQVMIFPNPFSGRATIIAGVQEPMQVKVKVQNLVGQVIAQTEAFLQPGDHQFDLLVTAAGIYLVSLTTDRGTTGYKVICTDASGSGNRIQYLGTESNNQNNHNNQNNLNNSSQPSLKSLQSMYSLGFSAGEIIHYQCTSGAYVTILADSPAASKNYEVEFSACADADGKNYSSVKIGDQVWMAENLAYLPAVSLSSAGSVAEKHYYVYGYEGSSVPDAKASASYDTYGALYNWEAARWACPGGWHLPSDAEWTTLTDFLGSPAGGKMKESGTERWSDPNTGATNESGLAARPGGFRKKSGGFSSLGDFTAYWSASLDASSYPWYRYLVSESDVIESDHRDYKDQGFSVRCVRGNTAPTASFTMDPATGTTETRFTFDASACTDAETPADDLEVRWDFDGDGTWDSDYDKIKITIYQYSLAGSYSVKLEVKDGGGLTHRQIQTVTVSYSTFSDSRDGNVYPYKTIGTQTWMIKNLAWLPAVSPSTSGSTDAKYYYVYGYQGTIVTEAKAASTYQTYGVLYNAIAAQDACPQGWHLPSDEECKVLEKYLGMGEIDSNAAGLRTTGNVGGKLKEAGTSHWASPNYGATNSVGFSALPAGYRWYTDATFVATGAAFGIWTSTVVSAGATYSRSVAYNTSGISRDNDLNSYGMSVRCVKNL
ncbi:MAG: PKD domain-containing protein [Bacteroidia bacterium]|nr:PKD domain-containing protein [Bacteroidia bacterium]